MNILICDDEHIYINEIKNAVFNYYHDTSLPVVIDDFTDGEAVMQSDLKHYDIAFLDIRIGKVKGMQIAKKLKITNPHILIFFITAYEQYLDDAMDLFAFRFLTKPLDMKRLLEGLKKATDMIDNSTVEFMLKDGGIVSKVFSRDIIYVEIEGAFTKVMTVQGEFLSTSNIEFWQSKLSATYFYRVHKSYIINTKFVSKYSRDFVVLDNKYTIPIAYRLRTSFRQYFLQKVEDLQK